MKNKWVAVLSSALAQYFPADYKEIQNSPKANSGH